MRIVASTGFGFEAVERFVVVVVDFAAASSRRSAAFSAREAGGVGLAHFVLLVGGVGVGLDAGERRKLGHLGARQRPGDPGQLRGGRENFAVQDPQQVRGTHQRTGGHAGQYIGPGASVLGVSLQQLAEPRAER